MVTLASMTSKAELDVVDEDYYAKSVQYQQMIDAKNRTAKLTQKPQFVIHKLKLTLHIPEALEVKDAQLHIYSPSEADEDRLIDIELKDNQFSYDLQTLRQGSWTLKLSWNNQHDEQFYLEENIHL